MRKIHRTSVTSAKLINSYWLERKVVKTIATAVYKCTFLTRRLRKHSTGFFTDDNVNQGQADLHFFVCVLFL